MSSFVPHIGFLSFSCLLHYHPFFFLPLPSFLLLLSSPVPPVLLLCPVLFSSSPIILFSLLSFSSYAFLSSCSPCLLSSPLLLIFVFLLPSPLLKTARDLQDSSTLSSLGVERILNAAREWRKPPPSFILSSSDYLHLQLIDLPHETLFPHIETAVDFIHSSKLKNQKVYIPSFSSLQLFPLSLQHSLPTPHLTYL
jgi:hypothetical protein